MMIRLLEDTFHDLVDLFYPRLCAGCMNMLLTNEQHICTYCLQDLPCTGFHLWPDNEVERIFWGRIPVEHATAFLFFQKGGVVQNILHHLKYKDYPELGSITGKMFGEALALSPAYSQIDIIVPVPLHPSKLKKRGYNQSEAISRGIGTGMDKPVVADQLVRTTHSPTQTRKSRYQRWENVESIFDVPGSTALKNRHILLVDDVVTTGATLEACGQSLITKCNCRISIATLAYASKIP